MCDALLQPVFLHHPDQFFPGGAYLAQEFGLILKLGVLDHHFEIETFLLRRLRDQARFDLFQVVQPTPDPAVNIASQVMFGKLTGKVTISGADFAFYCLQYRQALNPETWAQIGMGMKTPGSGGVLAE